MSRSTNDKHPMNGHLADNYSKAVASKPSATKTPSTVASAADKHVENDEGLTPITPLPEDNASHEPQYLLEKRDSYYVLPQCQFPPAKEYSPVEVFVAKAIQSRVEPTDNNEINRKGYNAILDAIRRRHDPKLLSMTFLAFRTAGNGSALHQLSGNPTKHAQLLHLLLRYNPFDKKESTRETKNNANKQSQPDIKDDPVKNYALADSYLHLLLALVSANSVFVVPALTSIWKQLTATIDIPLPRLQRLHATIAAMTRLCPKAKTEMFTIVSTNFPFRTCPKDQLVWCYRQAFAIGEYVPSFQTPLLQFVIDKGLEMDVEIKIHHGGSVSLDEDDDDDGIIFDIELNETSSTPQKERRDESITVDDMADKLDALLLLCFEFFEASGRHDVVQARCFYQQCLPAFEASILITHRSKFVQFILFYLCGLESTAIDEAAGIDASQQHSTLYREFISDLIDITVDPFRATVVRQSAACYLASFISRAKFVEVDTVCESICAMLRWADAYILNLQANSITAADARQQCDLHSLFYTICQAAFYIMCFRGEEAIQFYQSIQEATTKSSKIVSEEFQFVHPDQVDVGSHRWTMICGHGLQPLRYCLETVREEFLSVATHFHLLDESLLQRLYKDQSVGVVKRKKPSTISTPATLALARRKGGVGGLGRGSNPLDSFFPFDPYLLRRSHRFIDPFYRNWAEDKNGIDATEQVDMVDDNVEVADGDDVGVSDDSGDDTDEESSSDGEDERAVGSYESMVIASTPPSQLLVAPHQPWKRDRALSIENGSW